MFESFSRNYRNSNLKKIEKLKRKSIFVVRFSRNFQPRTQEPRKPGVLWIDEADQILLIFGHIRLKCDQKWAKFAQNSKKLFWKFS